MVTCFADAFGDFDVFIPYEVQVRSAELDGNVAWSNAGICGSFHLSDPVLWGVLHSPGEL